MKKVLILDFFGVLVIRDVADVELVTLMQRLKEKEMQLFVISNADEKLWTKQIAAHVFLQQIFDKLYYSGKTGFLKPDPRAYEIILTENDLQPEDCIYFDDNRRNVEVARSLGIESHVFMGSEDVQLKLSRP